jgi:tetratricopeptide (TPR) repeat protein
MSVSPGPAEARLGLVPPRNVGFTGRDGLLDSIRAGLTTEPWQPVVLYGLGGVGKTSSAAEYAYRHAEMYDVVWWVMAEQPSQALAALAGLGDRRDVPSSQNMRQTVDTVLAMLESADFRWLIVYDNATAPADLGDLLPTAGGHVIVTTRDAAWLERGRPIQVDVLHRRDSIALLRARGDVSFDEADKLSEKLGDLPLALEQAAAMRAATGASVAEYLRQLDERAYEVLDEGRPSDYQATVARAFGVTFAQVRRNSPAAAQLLELLSCLSAEPVSLTLLRAADGGEIPPPLGRLLEQQERLDEAIRLLRRYGLVSVVDDGQRLRVHRLVQLIVRDSLTEPERRRAYAHARRLLVAANPRNPGNSLNWEMYAQMGPHVEPTGLVTDPDPAVRRVVLDQARYLYLIGDFDGSHRLSEQARRAWAGPEDDWKEDQTFACLQRLINALQALGRYREADDLVNRVWDRLHEHPGFGPDHPRTAQIAAGLSRNHRILGRYGEALAVDQYREGFYRRDTDVNPRDRESASLNLAVSLRHVGDFRAAYDIDESVLESQRDQLGADSYLTGFTMSNLARDLFGLGRYTEALQRQQESLEILQARLPVRHEWVILTGRTIALGLRMTGRLAEALTRSREHFHLCSGQFGSDHVHTLAAAMTYANTSRIAVAAGVAGGRASIPLAWNLSTDAVNRYRRRFGERNPLTLAAAVNHAAILRAMGERIRARRTSEAAYESLYQLLGADHPYTTAAAIGLANDLAAAHEEEEAVRRLTEALAAAARAGRKEHPDTLLGGVNLGLILRGTDRPAGQALVDENLTALRRLCGPDHPQMRAVMQGQRAECDIEPPPP